MNFNSSKYWDDRYKKGGNSGDGSYNNLAIFKSQIINSFLLHTTNSIESIIDYGVGDGNQLSLLNLADKKYIGLVHLNGNEYKYTGKTGDKHALPLDKDDKIWPGISYKDSGCKYIIEWCNKNKVIFILEINCKRHTLVDVRNFLKLL